MRKVGGTTPLPVRFSRSDTGDYVVWDNGGVVGDRNRPYVRRGVISCSRARYPKLWTVEVDDRVIATNLVTLQAAKNTYLDFRAGRQPGGEPEPLTTPVVPVDWCEMTVDSDYWHRAEEWRVRVYRAMLAAGHKSVPITIMLTPVRTDATAQTVTLKLPEPIAEDLERYLWG